MNLFGMIFFASLAVTFLVFIAEAIHFHLCPRNCQNHAPEFSNLKSFTLGVSVLTFCLWAISNAPRIPQPTPQEAFANCIEERIEYQSLNVQEAERACEILRPQQ